MGAVQLRRSEMRMQCEEIEAMISQGLETTLVKVLSDDNTHFEALIVSPAFRGASRIRRHQMVYATLGEKMGGEIHAMSIQTLTPEEFSARGA